jgi:predicted component of type VI protein secretion system
MMKKSKEQRKMNLIITDAAPQTNHVTRYARRLASDEITYSIGKSTLGHVLVARSANGVCSILIGSEAKELKSDLATRFPESNLVRNDRKLSDDLQKVLHFIETQRSGSIWRSIYTAHRSSGVYGRSLLRSRPERS